MEPAGPPHHNSVVFMSAARRDLRKKRSKRKDEATEAAAEDTHPHQLVFGQGDPIKVGLAAKLRAYFLAGILITAPTAVTVYLAWLVITFIDARVTPLIPLKYNPETYLPFSIPGLGLIILVAFLTIVGATTAGLLGRILLRTSERLLNRMPIIRSVYGAAKQIFETVLAQQATAFREVALFEYPRRGTWAIGFVTNYRQGTIEQYIEDDLVSIMLPTTPNPTSGYLLFVPKSEIRILDITVEEAMKMIISGGIVLPGEELTKPRSQHKLPQPDQDAA